MTLKVRSKQIYQVFLFMGLLAIVIYWMSVTSQASGQSQNLLLNGDFEEGYNPQSGDETVSVAVGWTAFWVTSDLDIVGTPNGDQPVYMASDDSDSPFSRSNTGERAQLWHTKFSSAFAGVYQKVPVSTDSVLLLSAWTYAWSSTGSDPSVSQGQAWVRQRIGIDPTGGTDPNSENIVWSEGFSQHVDAWGQISVQATAQSDEVTVFLSAYPNRANPQNDIYFDSAELTLVSAALPTPVPIVSNGVPGLAPTIDPLLIGLITGQGNAPGQQGIDLQSRASGTDSGSPLNNNYLAPFISVVAAMMIIFLILVAILGMKQLSLQKARIESENGRPGQYPKDR